MTSYFSFEWVKMSHRWMPRIIVLLLVGLTVIAFWGQATQSQNRPDLFLPRGWLTALLLISLFASFFWPVLGGSWAGSEYGWGTIRTILTRRPSRIAQVAAALAILLVAAALAIIVVLVVATIAALIIAAVTGHSVVTSGVLTGSFLAVLAKGALASWYIAGFYIVLAYTAGTIFRSSAVGIGVGIGATFAQLIVGGIFRALGGTWRNIADHFPFTYTNGLVAQVEHTGFVSSGLSRVDPGTPSAGTSVLAIAIYAAIFLAITVIAVQTRDVTA